MQPYLFLFLTIVFDILGTACLKLSNGFTVLYPTLGVIFFDILLYVSFSQVLRHFNMSCAYALWSALSIAFIAVVGVLFFHEPMNTVKVLSFIIVIIGVVGLQLA